MFSLANMYLTMFPVAVGGILNMLFTKTKFYQHHTCPIDGGRTLKDGRRIFGDNKTYIGFCSMIVFCIIAQIFCGFLCNVFALNAMNDLYVKHPNALLTNIGFGFLIGFIYMLFELPNSFIKRRLSIAPGTTSKSLIGIVFFVVDQIDSLVGVMFLLVLFADISLLKYFGYVLLGAATHVMINSILLFLKVRKRI